MSDVPAEYYPDEAAIAGALWLDKVYPEWFVNLDLTKLDLTDPYWCVVGQVFTCPDRLESGFSALHRIFRIARFQEAIGWEWMFFHGFSGGRSDERQTLADAWILEVSKRQSK